MMFSTLSLYPTVTCIHASHLFWSSEVLGHLQEIHLGSNSKGRLHHLREFCFNSRKSQAVKVHLLMCPTELEMVFKMVFLPQPNFESSKMSDFQACLTPSSLTYLLLVPPLLNVLGSLKVTLTLKEQTRLYNYKMATKDSSQYEK